MEDRSTVRIVAPSADASGDRNEPQDVAITAASTSAQPVVPAGQAVSAGHGVWATFSCTQNFHIRFGGSGVGAAVTTDMMFFAGTHMLWVPAKHTHFRAIRNSADGTLTWYTSE